MYWRHVGVVQQLELRGYVLRVRSLFKFGWNSGRASVRFARARSSTDERRRRAPISKLFHRSNTHASISIHRSRLLLLSSISTTSSCRRRRPTQLCHPLPSGIGPSTTQYTPPSIQKSDVTPPSRRFDVVRRLRLFAMAALNGETLGFGLFC